MSVLSPSRLRRGLESPTLVGRELNRLYHRRGYTRPYNTDGVDIFSEDWDTLVILDACRFDMFEANYTLQGTLESRVSRGASTTEFLRGNFHSRDLVDTVYVTANPKLHEHSTEIDVRLHAIRDVWQNAWDETCNTVLPEQTTAAALEAAAEFPHKRSVVHYVQPHYPFLTDDDPFDSEQAFLRPDEPGSWHQVMTGTLSVSRKRIWDAYVATLDRALESVEHLLSEIEGRTVVTADHGNMVGERAYPVPVREWGHPSGIYTPELVRVPWHVHESGDRREIIAEPPVSEPETVADGAVSERLRQLGYVD